MTTTREQQLEAALRPFVDAYKKEAGPLQDDRMPDKNPRAVIITLGDCKRAVRALEAGS